MSCPTADAVTQVRISRPALWPPVVIIVGLIATLVWSGFLIWLSVVLISHLL